jgi:60 kDa SS-A/Ro ribonucleoprotein
MAKNTTSSALTAAALETATDTKLGKFTVDHWTMLNRFLIMGSESNTYYAKPEETAIKQVSSLERCIKLDGKRTIDEIVSVSDNGRAIKNDYAIFALAFALKIGSPETIKHGYANFNKVIRTGAHMLMFRAICKDLKKSGNGLRGAINKWYVNQDLDKLAYQLVKYQSRKVSGKDFSQRDSFRLSHTGYRNGHKQEGFTKNHSDLLYWVVKGEKREGGRLPKIVHAFEEAKVVTTPKKLVALIKEHGLTREMVPTAMLNDVDVWNALLQKMPMTAMIRNLGKMTSIGLLSKGSEAAKLVASRLVDEAYLRKSRVPPGSRTVGIEGLQIWPWCQGLFNLDASG